MKRQLTAFIIVFLLLTSFAWGAGTPFTATVSGDWDVSATWGNVGTPAVKGTDYPGTAADIFTINVSVVVKYNASETNELGAGTVNGTLWFPLDASTKITFGQSELTIGATGKLITSSDGTTANVGNVDDAFTCEFVWNTTGDNNKGLVITDGAYIDMRGDSALYGGTHSTTLAADWTSGQTLTATGTAPLSWAVNSSFTIARNTGTGTATVLKYTIASVAANGGNTNIVINEAAPAISFLAGGNIELENRNLLLYKLGATAPAIDTIYTLRPRVNDAHVTGTVKWTDASFTGFYQYTGGAVQTGGTFNFTNCLFRNGSSSFININYVTFVGTNAYSNSSNGFSTIVCSSFTNCNAFRNNVWRGFYLLTSCTLTNCSAYGQGIGFYTLSSCNLTSCNAYSNGSYNGGMSWLRMCTLVDCQLWANTGPQFADSQFEMIGGSIGWCGAVSAPNAVSFAYSCEVRLRNVKAPLAGYVFTSRNTSGVMGGVVDDDSNQATAWRFYGGFSTQTGKTTNPVSGGFLSKDGCIKVEPLSNISATNNVRILGGLLRSQEEGLAIWLPARQVTVKCRVQSIALDTLPTNAQLYMEVLYYADATTTMTTATSTETIAANGTTTVLSVTITPNRAGKAFVRLIWTAPYDADGYLLVDPVVNW